MTTRQHEGEEDLPRMTLPEHLNELRGRLIRSILAVFVCMLGSFFFYKQILAFVVQPYKDAAALQGIVDAKLWSVDPGEGFLQILKLCFLSGAVVAAPIVLWQMWGFISAGLYAHERRYVRLFFPVSVGLFALGVIAAYIILIPFGMRFLIGWNVELGLESQFRIQSYLSTCLTMVFGMGFLFELPLVMLFLQATDIVGRETFKKGWRVAVLFAFVIGMFLTDPSPVTQIMMAFPVIGLYYMGIWGGRFVGENAERFRIWKAWPLLIAALLFAAMLVFADQLNDWAASVFGADAPPASTGPE